MGNWKKKEEIFFLSIGNQRTKNNARFFFSSRDSRRERPYARDRERDRERRHNRKRGAKVSLPFLSLSLSPLLPSEDDDGSISRVL